MSITNKYERYTGEILDEIEAGGPVTQRELSRKLGIALGLTNLLIRRIVQKGWVKVTHLKANRVAYLITPTGLAEKGRLTQAYFENTIRLYTETRSRIRERLELLSADWEPRNSEDEKRVVFFGAGEVAEIGYISLQNTDLRLVGIVDDQRRGAFFGLPICRPEEMQATTLNGQSFEYVVVMTFRSVPAISGRLAALSFPANRVFWLDGDTQDHRYGHRAEEPVIERW